MCWWLACSFAIVTFDERNQSWYSHTTIQVHQLQCFVIILLSFLVRHRTHQTVKRLIRNLFQPKNQLTLSPCHSVMYASRGAHYTSHMCSIDVCDDGAHGVRVCVRLFWFEKVYGQKLKCLIINNFSVQFSSSAHRELIETNPKHHIHLPRCMWFLCFPFPSSIFVRIQSSVIGLEFSQVSECAPKKWEKRRVWITIN